MADARIEVEVDVKADGAQKALDKTAKAASKVKRGGLDAKAGLDATRKAAEAVQGPLGSTASRAIAAGEGIAQMAAAAGPAGLVIGALAVSIAGAGGAVYALNALVSAGQEANDRLDELREKGAAIPRHMDGVGATLDDAADSATNMSIEFDRLVEFLGEEAAPTIKFLTDNVAAGIRIVTDGLIALDNAIESTGLNVLVDKMENATAATSGHAEIMRSLEYIQKTYNEVEEETRNKLERRAPVQRALNVELQRTVELSFAAQNAAGALALEWDRLSESFGNSQARLNEASAELDRWLMALDQAKAQQAQAATTIVQDFASSLDSINALSLGNSEEVFRITQGIRIAEAQINAIAAAAAAFANPPGPPFTVPIAAAALAEGMAKTFAIAAVKPPSFHTGGSIGTRGGNAPDEQLARLRSNEVVMTRQQMSAMGASQPPVIQVQWKHRALDVAQSEVLRTPGSRSQRAVQTRPSGQRYRRR